jgi:histidinol-phosphate/aromatic aminotransferase/cobyric acid decarboxylase-like protein
MLAAITPNTRIVFVANPNNPTGTTASREELARFVNAVPANVLLALDEAYIEFLNEPLDLLPEIRNGGKPNLLLMRTFSKIYGLAGLRIGYGIGHPDFIAALEKIRQPFNINLVAQAGALAALDDTRTQALRAHVPQAEAGIHSVPGEFHPSPCRRRPARVRRIAEAGRDRASDGRLSIAGMDPHLHRHDKGKPAVP